MVGHGSLEPVTVVRIHVSQPYFNYYSYKMDKKIVAVGMSGGIDSTMAAYLLKKQGYEVVGITMSIYDKSIGLPETEKSGCYGPNEEKELEEAKKACEKIGIKHYVIDLKKQYKENVVDYFCDSYLDGKTPNPCVNCNAKMKFGYLLEEAKKSGINFDYFATGHYVRVVKDEATGRFLLKKGLDPKKDQSYFLNKLTQEQLSNLIFPIGEYIKEDLKNIAREVGLDYYADKDESQDFVEAEDYTVLFKDKEVKHGDIIDVKGNIVGKHNGIINYTIGQRKGLDLGGTSEALYVVKIDAENNLVIIGSKEYLYSKGLIAVNLNWISIEKLDKEILVTCKMRASGKYISCKIKPINNSSVEVLFDEEQMAIQPGQSIVFYNNDIVVGSGVIASKI